MNLDGDHEVRLNMPGAGKNSISGNHPNITEDVQLHPDQDDSSGLGSRKKVAEKTDLIATTSQSQQPVTEVTMEPPIPSNISQTENVNKLSATASSSEILETPKSASRPVTPRTSLIASPPSGEANDDDDENGLLPKRKLLQGLTVISIIFIVCIALVLTLRAMNKLNHKAANLEIWKWCLLLLPLQFGPFFFIWLKYIIAIWLRKASSNEKITDRTKFLIDNCSSSLLNGAVLSIYISLLSITWTYVITPSPVFKKSTDVIKALKHITKAISRAQVVAAAWLVRTMAVNFLKLSFNIKRFSEKIHENHFHQYILQKLSDPPVGKLSEVHSSRSANCSGSNAAKKSRQRVILRMIREASQISFYTLPKKFDKISNNMMNPDEQNNRNITAEQEAEEAGDLIFRNVAGPNHKYIKEEDVLRFMDQEEVDIVLPLIGGKDESGKINKKHFHKWVASMYMKGKFLEHSQNDIKEAMKTLLNFVDVVIIVVLILLWVILMRIATREVLLFISSQFLLAVFTFGNSAKSTLEAMIFVFLKHPFDVGDRCVIDGLQVVVEEISILTTVFLKYDDEKIYYPNSILATKSISNINRSAKMKDSVEFNLDVSTSIDNISALKHKIKIYIKSKPHLWRPKHTIRVREVADVNNVIKMSLYITHTLNFLDYEVKRDRRSNLVLELRNIFQQLGIKDYHILPSTSAE